MLIDYSSFLLSLRKQYGMEISKISKITGIDQFRYLHFESGNIVPTETQIDSILSVYNLTNQDILSYVKEKVYYPVVFSKVSDKIKITIPTLWMIGAEKEISGDFLTAYNESVNMIKEFFKGRPYIPINPNHIITNKNEYLIMVKYN